MYQSHVLDLRTTSIFFVFKDKFYQSLKKKTFQIVVIEFIQGLKSGVLYVTYMIQKLLLTFTIAGEYLTRAVPITFQKKNPLKVNIDTQNFEAGEKSHLPKPSSNYLAPIRQFSELVTQHFVYENI